MPRHFGALETYWVRMLNPAGVRPKYLINTRITAKTMYEAAKKASQWYLGDAPVFSGRHEHPTSAGYSTASFGVQGYGLRMWVREDY